MSNELAKSVGEINKMTPQQVTEMTTEVVEVTKTLHQTNQELDVLSSALNKLDNTKDEYDRKAKIVRSQLTNLAVKL